jgi:SAM-dependent methyltransferase
VGIELNIVTPLHNSTTRNYLERMTDDKIEAMKVAKKYGEEYWDGSRRYGYGGYKYIPGRWRPVAEKLISRYSLTKGKKILDIGCGKGFLLYEMQLIEPELEIFGIDISGYALNNMHPDLKGDFFVSRAQELLPYEENEFDLVISLGALHNLHIFELEVAFQEVERVGKDAFVMVESYRNEMEMFNLECWALTAETLIHVDDWKWLHRKFGYTGDYEFIFFE